MENQSNQLPDQSLVNLVEFELGKYYWENHRNLCLCIISLLKRRETPDRIHQYCVTKFGLRLTTDNILILSQYFQRLTSNNAH